MVSVLIPSTIALCDRWIFMGRIHVMTSVPGTGRTTMSMLLERYFRGQATANRLSKTVILRSALWSSFS